MYRKAGRAASQYSKSGVSGCVLCSALLCPALLKLPEELGMEQRMLRSGSAFLLLLVFVSFSGYVEAYKNYTVGDSLGWYDNLHEPSVNYQKWVAGKHFSLGDFLSKFSSNTLITNPLSLPRSISGISIITCFLWDASSFSARIQPCLIAEFRLSIYFLFFI